MNKLLPYNRGSELNDKIQNLYMGMNPKMMSAKRMGEVITCSLVDYKDIPVVALSA